MIRVVRWAFHVRYLYVLLTVLCLFPACKRGARQVTLEGQVLAVDIARQEITIKHGDIQGFMPGMTMPFKVRDPRLLAGHVPGDLVRATLVVEDSDAHLRTIERTGSGPVPPDAAPVPHVDVLNVGAAAPDAAFTDQTGAARRLSDWRGQAVAVTFVYTRCPVPNFCPQMDRHFTAVQDAVTADAALGGRVRLVSVTLDPAYDRPAVLAAHARRLAADPRVWTFLTGDPAEIASFASRFGVSVVPGTSAGAEIVHSLRTIVIDPEGRIAAILRGNEWTPQELTTALRTALAAR